MSQDKPPSSARLAWQATIVRLDLLIPFHVQSVTSALKDPSPRSNVPTELSDK